MYIYIYSLEYFCSLSTYFDVLRKWTIGKILDYCEELEKSNVRLVKIAARQGRLRSLTNNSVHGNGYHRISKYLILQIEFRYLIIFNNGMQIFFLKKMLSLLSDMSIWIIII